jgi:hypothetical protein
MLSQDEAKEIAGKFLEDINREAKKHPVVTPNGQEFHNHYRLADSGDIIESRQVEDAWLFHAQHSLTGRTSNLSVLVRSDGDMFLLPYTPTLRGYEGPVTVADLRRKRYRANQS